MNSNYEPPGSFQQQEACISVIRSYYKKFTRGHWAIRRSKNIYGVRNVHCWQCFKNLKAGKVLVCFFPLT